MSFRASRVVPATLLGLSSFFMNCSSARESERTPSEIAAQDSVALLPFQEHEGFHTENVHSAIADILKKYSDPRGFYYVYDPRENERYILAVDTTTGNAHLPGNRISSARVTRARDQQADKAFAQIKHISPFSPGFNNKAYVQPISLEDPGIVENPVRRYDVAIPRTGLILTVYGTLAQPCGFGQTPYAAHPGYASDDRELAFSRHLRTIGIPAGPDSLTAMPPCQLDYRR